MKPKHIFDIVVPSDPQFRPQTLETVYVRTKMDLDQDRYLNTLWTMDVSSNSQISSGPNDTAPRWSPDGSQILALVEVEEKQPQQLGLLTPGSDDRQLLTDFELGVRAAEWSPDGSTIAVIATTWTPDWAGLSEEERERRPRYIDSYQYRFDQLGWLHNRFEHLWLVDPAGETKPHNLTPKHIRISTFSWSPSGDRIAFVSDPDPKQLQFGSQIWEVETDRGYIYKRAERGHWDRVSYSPDGVLHAIGFPGEDWPELLSLWRIGDSGDPTNLTPDLDRNVAALVGVPAQIRWDENNNAYTYVEDSGELRILRIRPDGENETVFASSRFCTGFDISTPPDSDTSYLVHVFTQPPSPGFLSLSPLDDYPSPDQPRFSLGMNRELETIGPYSFEIERDDAPPLDVWVYMPPGEKKVPVLLNIHGGPASQYGWNFFDEFQVYARAGFGVVATNPRGSSGKGREFLREVTGPNWGVVDQADVLLALDKALEKYEKLDPKRQGIMGGSYGGFLTAWILAHHPERFSSAVVERAVISHTSFGGTSDIGNFFLHTQLGADYPDGWERWWETSPLSVAHKIKTPTLIVHSEEDFRCPIEQGEQLFTALLRNGTETAMVRFPGEGHELSRSGKPRHRLERFQAILDWHKRHLTPPTNPFSNAPLHSLN